MPVSFSLGVFGPECPIWAQINRQFDHNVCTQAEHKCRLMFAVCIPTLFYSRIIVRGYQPVYRCVRISHVNSCSTSYRLCRAVEISVLLACFMTIKWSWRKTFPGPISRRFPVITWITCRCQGGSHCHAQHLDMTWGFFNPNRAFSFNISCVAELGWGKQAEPKQLRAPWLVVLPGWQHGRRLISRIVRWATYRRGVFSWKIQEFST